MLHESFVYLGDTARLPYGSKSPHTIERYLTQNIRFLLAQNVKAVVVACNSASTVLLGKEQNWGVPVYNVIEPGAEAALQASQTKRIGVLGTKATVAAQAYVTAIHARDPQAAVFQQACPLLVPLVEEGWEDDPLTNLVVFRYLTPVLHEKVDTLILGCTHYPALRNSIAKVAGPAIELVDSAQTIADLLKADIAAGRIGSSAGSAGGVAGSTADSGSEPKPLKILTTDFSASFAEVATRLMSPHPIGSFEVVDIATA